MAQAVKRYYTMPKGPDGRRHREWHDVDVMVLQLIKIYYADMDKILSIKIKFPAYGKINSKRVETPI